MRIAPPALIAAMPLLLGPAVGCYISPPPTSEAGAPGDRVGPWKTVVPGPFGTTSDSGVIGGNGPTAPQIEVVFPNSGDEWRGARVTVVGRFVSPGDPIREAHVERGGARRPIMVEPDGRFEAPVSLELGHNVIDLSVRTESGATSSATIKMRRVPGMGLEPSAPQTPLPSVILAAPRKGDAAPADQIEVVGTAKSPSGVSRVEISANGEVIKAVPVKGGGKEVAFKEPVSLRPGTNVITVTAVDRGDRAAHEVASVLFTPEKRHFDDAPLPPIRRRYAVVIGVSKYRHGSQVTPLLYASRDAELFAGILRDADFDHVRLLLNEEATANAVRAELFDFLSEAVREDLVVIYFAGHGAPDPKNLGNLYLLTHETEVDRMASTALPMWEMETAIQRKIASERVILIADACHSGGIGSDLLTRGIQLSKNPAHDYLREMANARGRVAFTASEASELSQESSRWGGGHGVFTWSLAEGLQGKADADANGVISLGEVIDFTSEQVRRLTRNHQHPDTSGRFDRGLPLLILPGARGG